MYRRILSLVMASAISILPLTAHANGAKAPAPKTSTESGPLAAAGAAGVKQAQGFSDIPWVFVAGLTIAAVAVGIALAQDDDTATSTTTTTTGTN